MNNTRKLAIKNLKGSDEEMRVSWMLKNMSENKTFKYLLEDKKFKHQNSLLEELKKNIKLIEINGEVTLSLPYKTI